uniref:Uncharacterized protein n=1 Tax=Meloidogyne enterolobii TaxID=390850 RepID=A0A6V7VT75_MELEN|nr:unnamed protein product [Meloidogyne enterolobii]
MKTHSLILIQSCVIDILLLIIQLLVQGKTPNRITKIVNRIVSKAPKQY